MLKIIIYTILIILAIDLVGFIAWIVSGQLPVDNFYIGTITANIIKLFI